MLVDRCAQRPFSGVRSWPRVAISAGVTRMSMTLILPWFTRDFLQERKGENDRAVLHPRAAINDPDHGQLTSLDLDSIADFFLQHIRRDALWATALSCVTNTSVMFRSRCSRMMSSRMRCAFSLSRLPVGSSASKTEGRLARLRAMATRCLSPPESMTGKWLSRFASPTACSKSMARCFRSTADRLVSNIGICTFSTAVKVGSR
jgi:hypothetical protein